MLRQVAQGVRIHVSEFMQSNAVVVDGGTGVLLIDPGVLSDELAGIANDLSGRPVVAGFSTHPHWDHLLWHAGLGEAPRYGTARCAAAIQARLSDAGWRSFVAGMIPSDIVEHQAHAPGHAALLIEERGVLVAGDTLSDVLIPMLDLQAEDPIEDYVAALRLLEGVADDVDVVVPGHGSVGGAEQLRARIAQDRAYVQALRDGGVPSDPRIGPSATPGWEWVSDVHAWQHERLA